MRMTASWLDPLGSTEYKDVARDLCATLGRLASDRVLLAAGGNATGRSIPTGPSLAAVLGPVKEWPGNDLRGE